MHLIVKIVLLELALLCSTTPEAKTQSFIHLSLNMTLQLINDISNDCQKLLRYFNGTVIVAFFRIKLFPSATVFSNNFGLYWKDLK